jgi:predicted ABC-class ATPase
MADAGRRALAMAERMDGARDRLRALTRGSGHPLVGQALAQFSAASERFREAARESAAAERALAEYVAVIGGVGGSPVAKAASQAASPPSRTAGEPLSGAQVEQLREDLPVAVVSGTGQKTHGRWIDPATGDVVREVSGVDGDSRRVEEYLRGEQMSVLPLRTTDIEMKVAVRMRDQNINHLDVVLNQQPCRGRLGCDGMLPVLLAEGSSLAVHAPNFRKTYTGGAPQWWR